MPRVTMFCPQNNFLATILTISYLLNHSKQNSIATTSKENENKLEGKKMQIPNR